MLFVFGYRAQKIRSKKLSVLIHSSDKHKDVESCTVEVHFQKITDKVHISVCFCDRVTPLSPQNCNGSCLAVWSFLLTFFFRRWPLISYYLFICCPLTIIGVQLSHLWSNTVKNPNLKNKWQHRPTQSPVNVCQIYISIFYLFF